VNIFAVCFIRFRKSGKRHGVNATTDLNVCYFVAAASDLTTAAQDHCDAYRQPLTNLRLDMSRINHAVN
jgi:hypothetical protein